MLKSEFAFQYDKPALEVWRTLYECIAPFVGDTACTFGVAKTRFSMVEQRIEKVGCPHFGLESEVMNVDFCPVGNHNVAILFVEKHSIPQEALIEIHNRLSAESLFVQSRVYDSEYDFWQNADDELQYRIRGKSIAGLPLRSNGLPFPLERTIIDTSKNPGRRILRDGYIESVGHLLWLSEEFWNRVGQPREVPSWIDRSSECNGIDFLCLQKEPFSEVDAAVQVRLRQLLFGVTQ